MEEENNSMKCPEHILVDLREERLGYDDRSGFCPLCAKHYALCNAVLHMSICQKLEGHIGMHQTKDGRFWESI